MKNKLKIKLISYGIVIALLTSCFMLPKLLYKQNEIHYGIKSGNIILSEEGDDITSSVTGSLEYTVASNQIYQMNLTPTADIVITDKRNGHKWKAVPEGALAFGDKYASSMEISYFYNGKTTVLRSYADAVAKNQYRVYQLDNGVSVEYVFGVMNEVFIYPEQISEKRMKSVLKKLSTDDADYLKRRYTLYDISLADGDTREYLLSEYPRLKKEKKLYVLTDAATKATRKRTNEIFESIGYTEEDRIADNGGIETAKENPKAFKVVVDYYLTDNGFTAEVNLDKTIFYSDYPIITIDILPNFDSFCKQDKGYVMLPVGSGGIVDVEQSTIDKDNSLNVSVYGSDYSLTRKLSSDALESRFPVFGQYKNGFGYFCIINSAAEQSDIVFNSTSFATNTHVSFKTVDTSIYQMKSQNDTVRCSDYLACDKISAEYILMDNITEENAYSKMAEIYRNRLIESEILTDKLSDDKAPLIVEIIGSVEYKTLFSKLIPIKREFALTDFSEAQEIVADLADLTDEKTFNLLFSGWNKNGLNAQKPGSVKFSSVLGTKKEYEAFSNLCSDKNIPLYLNLELTTVFPENVNGYNATSNSTRSLNNSIVKLSSIDTISGKWKELGLQLLSPTKYGDIWKKYSNADFKTTNIGVSQFTSMLYSDYASGGGLIRSKASELVVDVLNQMNKNYSVLGNHPNLYALPYVNYLDGVNIDCGGNSMFSRSIPFTQMILHGSVAYCSDTMNDENCSDEKLLGLIETGSDLRYIITGNFFDKLFEGDFSYLNGSYYENIKENIARDYKFLEKALNGLADDKMISHSCVSRDIVKVEYQNGTSIYVNYSDSEYIYNNLKIPAKGYLRIGEKETFSASLK